MTSSYASLIDLRNDTESTLPQTKLGAAAGTKGGRLGENADTGRVVLCDGVHEIELDGLFWNSHTEAILLVLTAGPTAGQLVEMDVMAVEEDVLDEIDVLDELPFWFAVMTALVVAETFELTAFVVTETFKQLPNRLGRQLEQEFPAFTQAHPLHLPVLLHLQHTAISNSIYMYYRRPLLKCVV